jgi:outer membrane protein assembly factor BamB
MRLYSPLSIGGIIHAAALLGLLQSALSAQDNAADWKQFRGPGGLGVSTAKGTPTTWGKKDNLLWKTALPGPGTSSPIVVGDKIFLTCFTGYNVPGKGRGQMDQLKLHLVCLGRDKGDIVWKSDIEPKLPEQAAIRDDHGYASSTPVCDGERIYTFFGKSGVVAFDMAGKQLWRADVGSELNGWGSATSPILHGSLVIVNASIESQSLVALDQKSGKEVWRAKGIREAWNTPLLVNLPDGKVELVVGTPGKVLAFDPASGESLWSCDNNITWYIVPSAVAHDGVVWSIGGRSGVAAVAVKAGGRGDVTKTHRLWTSNKGSNVSSPILHEGHLYWMHDNTGVAYCAEAKSGKIVYEERVPGAGQTYASALLADGKLYYVSREGRTLVLAASPKFERLALNDLSDRSIFNASPAVAGSRLLLRSDLFLYCVGEK